MKYLVGSKLLGLSNCHDEDYITLVDGNEDVNVRKYIDYKDVVVRSVQNVDKCMNFELPLNENTARYYIVNYQMDKEIIGQNFPLEYRILDRRSDYVSLLNWIVDNKACNFIKLKNMNHGHCSKLIYHIAYLTFILENNSTSLTAEQKETVQQIHDRAMPMEYLDELAEKIRNL